MTQKDAVADEYAHVLAHEQPNFSGALSEILLRRALNIARNPNAPYNLNELVANVVKLREIEFKSRTPPPRPLEPRYSPARRAQGA